MIKYVIKHVPVLLCFFLLFLLHTSNGRCTQPENSKLLKNNQTESDELEALNDHLNYVTQIATKTYLNADFTPGMVSVFYGNDLEDTGVRTVGEAINRVPGIYLSLSDDGFWKTIIRGVPKKLTSGHIKILLNGTPMTTEFGIDSVPNIPIEQVDRIEVIRGAASAIHGEYAFSGVLNIITKKERNRVFGTIGTQGSFTTGTAAAFEIPSRKIDFSLNIAGYSASGATLNSQPQVLAGTDAQAIQDQNEISSTNIGSGWMGEKRQYLSGICQLGYKKLNLQGYGFRNFQKGFFKSNHLGLVLDQPLAISKDTKFQFNLGAQVQTFTPDSNLINYTELADPSSQMWIYQYRYDERSAFGAIELDQTLGDMHECMLEWSFGLSQIVNVMKNNLPLANLDGKRRFRNSVTLQDTIKINDQLTLIGSGRYDHYNDLGDTLSPRMAITYRINKNRSAINRHIIKAQFAKAFRPPTFLDLYAKSADTSSFESLKEFETIDTFEIGYIYKRLEHIFRCTLFYSELDARVSNDSGIGDMTGIYQKGAEAEFETHLFKELLSINANLSYVLSKEQESGNQIPESADWISNIGLMLNPLKKLSIGLSYQFVAKRAHLFGQKSDGFNTLDLTLALKNIFANGFIIRSGLKNVFENDFRYHSDSATNSVASRALFIFPEQNEQPSRFWWMEILYEF